MRVKTLHRIFEPLPLRQKHLPCRMTPDTEQWFFSQSISSHHLCKNIFASICFSAESPLHWHMRHDTPTYRAGVSPSPLIKYVVKINIYILIFFDSEQTWAGGDVPSPDIMSVSTLATPHLASIAQQRPALCNHTRGGGGMKMKNRQ